MESEKLTSVDNVPIRGSVSILSCVHILLCSQFRCCNVCGCRVFKV